MADSIIYIIGSEELLIWDINGYPHLPNCLYCQKDSLSERLYFDADFLIFTAYYD